MYYQKNKDIGICKISDLKILNRKYFCGKLYGIKEFVIEKTMLLFPESRISF